MFEAVTQKKSVGRRLFPWIVVIFTLVGLWFLSEALNPTVKPKPRQVFAPTATVSPAPPTTAPAPPPAK